MIDPWPLLPILPHPSISKELEEMQEFINQKMLDFHALQAHPPLMANQLGGLGNGNWHPASQAYSNTANQPSNAGQLSQHSITSAMLAQLQAYHFAVDPAREPLKSAGVKFGEFLGWRMWFVDDLGYLHSYSQRVMWVPQEPMKGEPTDYGHEGIWAFKDKSRAVAKMVESYQETRAFKYVIYGSVHLYGDVVEHEDGYRSSVAKIVSLDDIVGKWASRTDKQEMLKELRERYL